MSFLNQIPLAPPTPPRCRPNQRDSGGVPTQNRRPRRRRSLILESNGGAKPFENWNQNHPDLHGLQPVAVRLREGEYLSSFGVGAAHAEELMRGAFGDVQQVVGEVRFE